MLAGVTSANSTAHACAGSRPKTEKLLLHLRPARGWIAVPAITRRPPEDWGVRAFRAQEKCTSQDNEGGIRCMSHPGSSSRERTDAGGAGAQRQQRR
jgi:hypothetical protein